MRKWRKKKPVRMLTTFALQLYAMSKQEVNEDALMSWVREVWGIYDDKAKDWIRGKDLNANRRKRAMRFESRQHAENYASKLGTHLRVKRLE